MDVIPPILGIFGCILREGHAIYNVAYVDFIGGEVEPIVGVFLRVAHLDDGAADVGVHVYGFAGAWACEWCSGGFGVAADGAGFGGCIMFDDDGVDDGCCVLCWVFLVLHRVSQIFNQIKIYLSVYCFEHTDEHLRFSSLTLHSSCSLFTFKVK